jgi:hypothetical protein
MTDHDKRHDEDEPVDVRRPRPVPDPAPAEFDPDDHDNLAWRAEIPPRLDVDEARDGRVRGLTIHARNVQATTGTDYVDEVVLGVDPAELLDLATGVLDAVRRLVLDGPSDRPRPSATFHADTQRSGLALRAGPAGRWEVTAQADGRVLAHRLSWSEVVHYLAATTAPTPATEWADQ